MDIVLNSRTILKKETGTVVYLPASRGRRKAVFKLYRHRGIINTIRGWLVRYRAQREYEHLCFLSEHSIACTEPLGWTHGHSPRHGFYEALATREISGARNLESLRDSGHCVDLGPLFSLIRRMHRSGFRHHALYARNILVRDSGGRSEFFIADTARSRIFPQSINGSRQGRLDLVDLIASIATEPRPAEQLSLHAWGFSKDEAESVRRSLDGYKKTRPRRVAKDLESRVRHLTAWLAFSVLSLPSLFD